MAATKSELWTQLGYAIKIVDETLKYGNANTPNFVTMLDTLSQALEGSHISATVPAFNTFRSNVVSLVQNSAVLTPLILELAKIGYASRATTVSTALEDIWVGMTALSETVKNRAWTYGSLATTVGNVGTGIPYRLTKDESNASIETGSYSGGIVKIEVTRDKNTGSTSGAESASLYGYGITSTDPLEPGASPSGSVSLAALRSEDGRLTNSSFDTYTGTGATLAFTGWTTTTPASSAANTSIYFQKSPGLTTGTSIEFTGNNKITQWIGRVTSSFNAALPVMLIARYRRKNSCDGSLTMRLGTQTVAIADLTTKTDATWYDLVIGDSDEHGWYDNFKEDDSGLGARVSLELASRTTGELLIDSVLLVQPTYFDGKYYLLTSGSTDFQKGDSWTWTDSVLNTGRIQTTIARLFGTYLPHTSGSPTYADA